MTRKTERKSKTAEPAKARKLTLKKDTLKDLSVPRRAQGAVRAGGSGGGGSVAQTFTWNC